MRELRWDNLFSDWSEFMQPAVTSNDMLTLTPKHVPVTSLPMDPFIDPYNFNNACPEVS